MAESFEKFVRIDTDQGIDYEKMEVIDLPEELWERYYDYVISRTSIITVDVPVSGYVEIEELEKREGRKLNRYELVKQLGVLEAYTKKERFIFPDDKIPHYKKMLSCTGMDYWNDPNDENICSYEVYYMKLSDPRTREYFINNFIETYNVEKTEYSNYELYGRDYSLSFWDKDEKYVASGGITEIFFHSEEEYNEFKKLNLPHHELEESYLEDGKLNTTFDDEEEY